MPVGLIVGLAAAVGGLFTALLAFMTARRTVVDLRARVLQDDVEQTVPDEFQRRLAIPLHRRLSGSLSSAAMRHVERFLPRNHLEGVGHRLTLSGAKGVTASEFVTRQGALGGVLGLLAIVFVLAADPPPRITILLLVTLPSVGLVLPRARLSRRVTERQQAILKDLPDTLDLLAVSVEAGMGFEGAIDVVCQHFRSPLAEEFSLTLREMELGMGRREAFQDLKRRTEVPELSNFVLAVLQADALGIPIGRVLKTQAEEMRSKRRMWAREKAGKLPVKILFPLIGFIFPPIMVIVMGPAAGSIGGGLG
jgi:tight adherence protein C